MKTEIENLLKMLGIQGYQHMNNIDNHWEGFYYNTTPDTLIRVMISIGNNSRHDSYIAIDRFVIITHDYSVYYKQILKGRVILTDTGEFNSDFYAGILSNLNHF